MPPQTTNTSAIDQYLSADLFEQLGIDLLTPEERLAFTESFGNVIHQRLINRLIQTLSEEQQNELEKLMDTESENPQALWKYLQTAVPNLEEITNEEVAAYKKELIDRMNA